jgi:hypothetical protein
MFAVILMAGSLFVPAGVQGDGLIRHPIACYQVYRACAECPRDSVLVGRMTYEPMPRYQQESRLRDKGKSGRDEPALRKRTRALPKLCKKTQSATLKSYRGQSWIRVWYQTRPVRRHLMRKF